MIGLAQQLVECESPSGNGAAIARFVELVADTFAPYGEIRTCSGGNYGPHLICAARLPGLRTNPNPILVLGHSDTVWPLGTLRQMPFRCEDGRLWGPGVFDMKAGIVFFRFALEALKELEIPVTSPVRLQLNSDEEVGSPTSRALTEANAAASRAVLVLEPGTGPKGKLKTARKGVGQYRILVRGKAAHAGLDFQTGASATLELARQLDRIAGFTNLERGITVNPGVIAGGTRPNVVAAEAWAEIDVRIQRPEDAVMLDEMFHALSPCNPRCAIEVSGGLNRPPMPRSPGTIDLFQVAQRCARDLGIELDESSSGGGSDGNFTAALGIPTLDGLGAVGEGAHAINESILIGRMADRTALLAKLLAEL
ncbi:MAG: M20 family metallopeptidase [Acidobacteriia bacterium]|nr:M20 family metallopeptidase [Terriglobia bacterium]